MAKTMKKLYSKLQKQQQGWTKSQTRQENTHVQYTRTDSVRIFIYGPYGP